MLMPILPPLVLLLVIEYFATDLPEIWGLLVFVLMPLILWWAGGTPIVLNWLASAVPVMVRILVATRLYNAVRHMLSSIYGMVKILVGVCMFLPACITWALVCVICGACNLGRHVYGICGDGLKILRNAALPHLQPRLYTPRYAYYGVRWRMWRMATVGHGEYGDADYGNAYIYTPARRPQRRYDMNKAAPSPPCSFVLDQISCCCTSDEYYFPIFRRRS